MFDEREAGDVWSEGPLDVASRDHALSRVKTSPQAEREEWSMKIDGAIRVLQ